MTLPKFAIYSHRHELIPFARRLEVEGAEVSLSVINRRYERAWEGMLKKDHLEREKGRLREAQFVEQVQAAQAGELVVLTDNDQIAELFEGAPRLFSAFRDTGGTGEEEQGGERFPFLYIGGWFDEGWRHVHWWIPDWGSWPGGIGPMVLGAGTMFAQRPFKGPQGLLDLHTNQLKDSGFRGLCQLGLGYEQVTGQWQELTFRAGWPWLHTHAFLWEIPLSSLLLGLETGWSPHSYTLAVPVSSPPWPLPQLDRRVNITPEPSILEGADATVRSQLWLHDIQVRDRQLWTAGLDGMVAVAVGTGQTMPFAKMKAGQVVAALKLWQKQWRPDAGAAADAVVAGLEAAGLLQ